ncbi:MAG: helix-turn-helix transcriptional regulator [Chloroflexota bacterium]
MGQRGRPRHPEVLTLREQEVLALVREGLTNEQIAERLGVSFETAKAHVGSILSKLGVESREEAAAWRPRREPLSWLLLGAAAAALASAALAFVLVLGFGWLKAGDGDNSSATSTPTSIHGLSLSAYYLPPDDGSPWIASSKDLQDANIHVISSVVQLQANYTADAFIIDKEWFPQVDQGTWLFEQRDRGAIIVAGRTDITHLKMSIGVNYDHSGDWDYPGNFFSLYHKCVISQDESGAQQYLDQHGNSGFKFMLTMLQKHSNQSCPGATATAQSPAIYS